MDRLKRGQNTRGQASPSSSNLHHVPHAHHSAILSEALHDVFEYSQCPLFFLQESTQTSAPKRSTKAGAARPVSSVEVPLQRATGWQTENGSSTLLSSPASCHRPKHAAQRRDNTRPPWKVAKTNAGLCFGRFLLKRQMLQGFKRLMSQYTGSSVRY